VRLSLTPPSDRSACQFLHRVRTRFVETDAMGVVHHGVYATYLEEARAAFLEAAGHPYGGVRESGVEFTVLELYVAYRRPLHFAELVDVGLTVGALTRTTFQVGYLLDVDGEIRSTATSVHAALDPEGRPARLPRWMPGVAAFGRRI
jgi:acyl-CoA thioester hydrolase